MWNGCEVSVVLMTYAERDSIRRVIDGLLRHRTGRRGPGRRQQRAGPGPPRRSAKTRARLVHEPRQGYGHATRRGLIEAPGDLIVLAEPDGTFLPEDILKLLVYSTECDAVFGTRTTRELIWAGANMAPFLRWGNWARGEADRVPVQHQPPQRRRLHVQAPAERTPRGPCAAKMTIGGSHAGAEIMLLTILRGARVRRGAGQLPARAWASRRSPASALKAVMVGLAMIRLVLRYSIMPLRADPAADRLPRAAERPGRPAERMSSSHFDEIAGVYDESLPAHVVEHYLRKRTAFVARALPVGERPRRRLRHRSARPAARRSRATR